MSTIDGESGQLDKRIASPIKSSLILKKLMLSP
jgi:hypothetical protein